MSRLCTELTTAMTAVALLGSLACSSTDRTAPRPADNARSVPLSADRMAVVIAQSALPHTPARFRWLALAHTNAMQAVVGHVGELRKMDLAHRCVALAKIARDQFATIEAGSGVHDRGVYESALSRALARINCPATQPTSIWTLPDLATRAPVAATAGAPSYLNYSDALQTAMQSGETADQTAANLDAVVVSATDLSPEQHDTLAALASLGASSASYWYNLQISNGYSSSYVGDITVNNNPQIIPTFLFQQTLCGTWCKAGWADLAAGLIASETLVFCIVASLATSAATIIGLS